MLERFFMARNTALTKRKTVLKILGKGDVELGAQFAREQGLKWRDVGSGAMIGHHKHINRNSPKGVEIYAEHPLGSKSQSEETQRYQNNLREKRRQERKVIPINAKRTDSALEDMNTLMDELFG